MATEAPRPFGSDLPPWPQTDHSAWGEVEVKPLGRIQKLTAGFLHRNWVSIPHVTHHDEADVTALEVWRKQQSTAERKLTLLPYLVKASVQALREFPHFNASLDASGNLVLKKYFNIGVAVDTPNGLLVPVVHNADRLSVPDLADRIGALSAKAREKGLPMADMSGGCFSISALGALGGTAFTPIINAPEVAILGVTKTAWKPTRGEGDAVVWRLMCPLSLSYDHRVINGADAARFVSRLAVLLGDPQAMETTNA
jgi:pyruvate dehydrogenase E2 component (dihydrolipoamide acetyltransferase)